MKVNYLDLPLFLKPTAMKKIFTLFVLAIFCLCFSNQSKAQTQADLYLDYQAMDFGYTSTIPFDTFDLYYWNMNKNYVNDSAYTFRFACVFFDSIMDYDYNNNALLGTYPLNANTTVRLDSFDVYYKHARNVTTSTDTLYMTVFDISTATITGTGPNAVLNFTPLWRDSLKVSGTANMNSSGTNIGNGIYTFTRRPNYTLPAGRAYGIHLEFRGNKANYFQVYAGGRDACSSQCGVEQAYAPNNSLYYLNLTQQGNNFSGINPVNYNCDGNGVPTPGNCEFFESENIVLPSYAHIVVNSGVNPPTVVTTAATNVAQTTATLNGTVNANGNTASVSFEWGLTTSYGNTATATPASVSGSVVTPVSANLTGLVANTTYHFRVKATNNGGPSNGNDLTFTTLAGSPCTPNGNVTSGLDPVSSSISCINQGQAFTQTFTFVIPATISGFAINSVTFNTILNLPTGLTYAFSQTPATYAGGATGCFIVSGTTQAPCGQYAMPIYVTVNAGFLINGRLDSLATALGIPGFDMRYLRVKATAGTCPTVNANPLSWFVADATCGIASSLSVSATKTDVNCFGQSTGSATATPSGGTSPYSYAWSGGGSTAIITNKLAGTYTVTVTDATQATATASVTIGQPASALSVTTSSTQAACGQTNGTATATPAGGTTGYTYLWSNSGSSATISNLAAGNYSVTVTDSKGCTSSATVTVSTPANFNLSVSTTNVTCFGQSTGTATATATGGSGFTYSWSNSGNTAVISNLPAGSYSVTVTDANSCVKIASGTVTQPANALSATASSTPSSCGSSTGTATVSVTNNVGSPTYVWSPGGGTAQTINGLSANTYTVTVTAGGCTATASTSVNNSNGPTITIQKVDPTCFGSTNGSATALVSGGTPGYTYLWSNNATGSSLNGLAAGTLTLIVTDNAQCSAFGSVTLVQPNPITLTETVTNVNCNGAQTGAISLTIGGGTGPYIYGWSNSSSSSSIANLSAGSYTVTVTDSRSCTAASTYTVTQPTALVVTTTSTASTGSNGTATATVSGGTSPYNYTWSGTPTQTTAVATALASGSYSITVTDSKGCSATSSVTVNTTVGITEASIITSFSLFPNPANDKLNVVIDLGGTHSIQLNVTDISGKVVYAGKEIVNGKMTHEINVNDFNGGVYVIEAIANRQAIKKRFTIIR